MLLRARQFSFTFPRPTLLMGIVNVTPDSFSDGGRFLETDAAVGHALQLAEEGAEIIDIGGESTRPNAIPVTEAEELRRVLPVLEKLVGRLAVPISIDTYKPGVARAALQAGASIVNDIGAANQTLVMAETVAETQAGYVLMHMQGTPQTMQRNPSYQDVQREVGEFFSSQLGTLTRAGVSPDQVVLDVGIGFGKRREHNLQLLGRLPEFARLGRPLLVGASRKSFLASPSTRTPEERLPAALAVACWAVQAGVQIIRTHDVRATGQAIRMFEEILQNLGPRA